MPGQRREGDGGRMRILLARQSGGVWAEEEEGGAGGESSRWVGWGHGAQAVEV